MVKSLVAFKAHVVLLSLLLCAAALMSDIYEDHKDEDGFLYITYSGENTFGYLAL